MPRIRNHKMHNARMIVAAKLRRFFDTLAESSKPDGEPLLILAEGTAPVERLPRERIPKGSS